MGAKEGRWGVGGEEGGGGEEEEGLPLLASASHC